MSKFFVIQALLVLLLGVFPVATVSAEADSAKTLPEQVDEVFAEFDSTTSPGCSLAVIQDSKIIYERGYGMASLDYDIALSPQSVFRIASTSKQFTAMSIALLAEEGTLSLDDDIRKYFPEFPEYDPPVTIRHLVHHMSGIRDYLDLMWLKGYTDAETYTNEQAVEIIGRQSLNFNPGDEMLYSNSGYFLLSLIVQKASGKTLREYANEHIFQPLGMHHTHFHDNYREVVKNRADGYEKNKEGKWEISRTTLEMVGDGGVFTTVEDLYLWDQNFYHNKLGKGDPELIQQVLTPGKLNNGEVQNYAFGLGIDQYKGLTVVRHSGGFVGYRAQLMRFPEQSFSVICLCNTASANPSTLSLKVADIYLADQFTEKTPSSTEVQAAKLSEKDLNKLAGHYYSRSEGLARQIQVQEGKLFYVRDSGSKSELLPIAKTRFAFVEVPTTELHFELAGGEKVTGMKIVYRNEAPTVFEAFTPVTYLHEQLERFTGSFYSRELDVLHQVSAEKDELVVKMGNGKELIHLKPAFENVFTGDFALEFAVDPDGQVSGFTLNTGRVRNMKFDRARNSDPVLRTQ